jgi:hypothetical protein
MDVDLPPLEGGNVAPKHAVDDRFVQKPHVTPFGGKAGAPLPRMEVPAYTKYKNTLAEVDDNPWARSSPRLIGKLRAGPRFGVPLRLLSQTCWLLTG